MFILLKIYSALGLIFFIWSDAMMLMLILSVKNSSKTINFVLSKAYLAQ
jgi:hypothetical protein